MDSQWRIIFSSAAGADRRPLELVHTPGLITAFHTRFATRSILKGRWAIDGLAPCGGEKECGTRGQNAGTVACTWAGEGVTTCWWQPTFCGCVERVRPVASLMHSQHLASNGTSTCLLWFIGPRANRDCSRWVHSLHRIHDYVCHRTTTTS